MMKTFISKLDQNTNPKKIVFIFLLVWLLVNLVQSALTELHPDEAYYWMYSRYLAWGYFDHPPMIALLVKAGYALFKNELGVRLFTSIMGTATIFLIYVLLSGYLKRISVFLFIASSVIILQSHVGGFLAIPDLPLVFFSALFFVVYKEYLKNDKVSLALLLAVVAAGMLYSKYHGVLVLFFTLISNLKIFRRPSFYIIPVLLIFLMIPHLLWQINNEFPTFQYHLVSRSSSYRLDFTLNYLYSQLLIAGPFVGVILIYQSIHFKAGTDIFLRAMKYNFAGFFIFFFLMSFKGRVEAHWTAIAYIPLVIISAISLQSNQKAFRWVQNLFIPTILVFVLLRISLIYEIFPSSLNIGKDFHNWDTWAKQVQGAAKGRKVVFEDSFQLPSKYAFYTGGEFTHTLNSIYYRKNQYDLWHGEDSIQGKAVMLMRSRIPDDTLHTPVGDFKVKACDKLYSYYSIKVEPKIRFIESKADSLVEIEVEIINRTASPIEFISADSKYPVRFCITMHDGKNFLKTQYLAQFPEPVGADNSINQKIRFTCPTAPGKYRCYISIINDLLYPPQNGSPIELIVSKKDI